MFFNCYFVALCFSILFICVSSPFPAVVPLISGNGKKLFQTEIDKVLKTKFASIQSLPKEINELENEFDIWKSVLSSSTAGIILLLIVVILYLQRKNNAKFLQLSEKCLQFKIKIKNIEKKTANLINNE